MDVHQRLCEWGWGEVFERCFDTRRGRDRLGVEVEVETPLGCREAVGREGLRMLHMHHTPGSACCAPVPQQSALQTWASVQQAAAPLPTSLPASAPAPHWSTLVFHQLAATRRGAREYTLPTTATAPCTLQKSRHDLEVHYADSPLGPWHPHAANPVMSGSKRTGARMGGRVVPHEGKLLRFGQDCGDTYGHRVRCAGGRTGGWAGGQLGMRGIVFACWVAGLVCTNGAGWF